MAKGKGKGSQFERDICFTLSKWWTDDKRSDVFWRSSMSGGRATVRNKKGLTTHGNYGDIAIADPIGQPLIELATIELKTGYPGQSPFDMVDRVGKQNPKYKQFFEQCEREKREAQVPFWMLIARRKQKDIMIYIPFKLYTLLSNHTRSHIDEAFPSVRLSISINSKKRKIFGCPLSEFFKLVKASHICDVLKIVKGVE